MLTFVKEAIAKGVLKSLRDSNDTKTTILGVIAAAILAQQTGLDFGKLFQGDPNELGKLAGCLVVALLSYYVNKPNKPAAPPEPPKQ